MANWETNYSRIIKEIALEENISLTSFDDWAFKLSNGIKYAFIYGYQFGLDNAAVSGVLKDKAATYEMLKSEGIPAVPHFCVMNPINPEFSSLESAWDFIKDKYKEYGKLVLKNNLGTGGREVYLARSMAEVEKACQIIFSTCQSMAVSPYVNIISEFRAVTLNGQVRLLFEKLKPEGSWKHNLGQGAKPLILDENNISLDMEELVLSAVRLFNLRFASVDVVLTDEGFRILEINGGVMMENIAGTSSELYSKAKEIYREAILDMLK